MQLDELGRPRVDGGALFQRLLEDYRRAADRIQWAEQMDQKGYVSKAQFDIAKASFRKTAISLGLD